MKILCYRNKPDFYFESIISCLSKIKNKQFKIGFLSGEINAKMISEFNPDVIIHNIENVDKFPVNKNVVSININETDNENSFSFKKHGPNFLKPFVTLKQSYVEPHEMPRYSSDVVFIGSPLVLGNLLPFLSNDANSLNFKFFTHTPYNMSGYCGLCDSNDYFKFYRYANASLYTSLDAQRIMDIIIADGNPVLYDEKNIDKTISDIKMAVFENKKYSVDGMSKEDIINNETSFDRASQVFKIVGLNKLAQEIIKTKKTQWNIK